MAGAYTTLPTYTLPGRVLGLNDVTARVMVIQFNLKICTGLNFVLPLTMFGTQEAED